MKKQILNVLALGILFTACPKEPVVIPASATLNGYTFADKAAGKVNFGISALDNNNQVLKSGQISNPSVSNLQGFAANGVQLKIVPRASATATVCANITVGSDAPIVSAIVLDATGSMKTSDPTSIAGDLTTTARNKAAKAFIDRMRSSDKASSSSFDFSTLATNPYRAIKLTQDFTSDKTLLKTGVNAATKESGGTNLWDAVFDASDLLETQNSSNKIALILTDGLDTNSSSTVTQAILNAQNKNVKVYMIGLGSDLDAISMEKVARETNGLFAKADQASQLTSLFNGVFNSIQAQGCIQMTFDPVPAPGTTVTGTLKFQVNGVQLSTTFTVVF